MSRELRGCEVRRPRFLHGRQFLSRARSVPDGPVVTRAQRGTTGATHVRAGRRVAAQRSWPSPVLAVVGVSTSHERDGDNNARWTTRLNPDKGGPGRL
jgi:hypothetical protein